MIFKGSATALITPFTKDGIDFTSLKNLIEFQIAGGTDALVVLGTTGEPATMTSDEKSQVIDFTVKQVAGRIPVIVGTGANSTATSIKNSIEAEKAGADALLVVTPYYNKCTQDGLVQHYNAIADAVNIPIICYNVPGRTGVNVLPETFSKIADHKNVVAMKEASGNMEQIEQTIALSRGKADVYSGDDSLIVPVLAMGGIGIISVASNVVPKYVSDTCKYFFDGNLAASRDMQLNMLPLVKALFSEVNPIPVKAASKYLGLSNGLLRLPLTEITAQNEQKLIEALNALK